MYQAFGLNQNRSAQNRNFPTFTSKQILMSALTIYKASAGSGKTYTITGEYIKLLFADPENYRHILGVTFTNKATAEMKSRIVFELFKLSRGEKSGYTDMIFDNKLAEPGRIEGKASYILSKILHDYSHFTISTIDSFFQRVIRTFAREVGFFQGFELELDQEKVLTAAIDQMIYQLDKYPDLKNRLVKFAEEKILEGKSWNINKDIESLGKELFRENFRELADRLYEKISKKGFLDTFQAKLNKEEEVIENEIRAKASQAVMIMEQFGLKSDDFNRKGTGIGAHFLKASTAKTFADWKVSDTIKNHLDNPDAWSAKKSEKKSIIENAYHQGLNRILWELLQIYADKLPIYNSIQAVQKHIYVLGMIADLQAEIRSYTTDRNLFLISDTAELLYKLIDGSDAPFVYERTGSFINHFMIDEFQDTSQLQWKNFKPLIVNSLAENNANWVVGDVKQSIYRWRNSDWTILSGKIEKEILPHRSEQHNLQYNWRSSANIIKFNNTFFRNAIDVLTANDDNSENITGNEFNRVLGDAYAGFGQVVPDQNKEMKGLVQIEFVSVEDKKSRDWQNSVLEKLPQCINQVQDGGYSLSDAAILVRTRAEAKLISDFLLNYQKTNPDSGYRYDILSGDSLLLKNSEVVKWIVAFFRYIIAPDDSENLAFLVYQYFHFIKKDEDNEHAGIFSPGGEAKLPVEIESFFSERSVMHMSVYELTDHIILYFGLPGLKDELPFLLAFQDMMQDYTKKEPVDINSFLRWWDDHQDKKVISMPDSQNAMRLMTFHSSKGLEFPVVIIPFGDWEFMKHGNDAPILWCRPGTARVVLAG